MRFSTPATALYACALLLGCGGGSVGTTDGGEQDAGATDASMPDDGGLDAGPRDAGTDAATDAGVDAAMPVDRRPCETGSCWESEVRAPRCAYASHSEDYSSGSYNVHVYHLGLAADVPARVEMIRTGGSWQPAVIVRAWDGSILFDGAIANRAEGIEATVDADGRTGDRATLSLTSDRDRIAWVYATGWSAIDGGFSPFPPTDATYDIDMEGVCDGGGPRECTVNGHGVPEPACAWLHHVGGAVVPALEGDRGSRLTDAARVAWWSLKEGVAFLDNPIVYSNCNFPDGDARIGPLETCVEDRAWQVGLSGVQVPYAATLAEAEATAGRLFPSESVDDVLETTACEALLDADTAASVVGSEGYLRRSWLLRNSGIGFTHQVDPVTRECIDDTRSWCYGTGWDTTAMYAPDREGALRAIDDIRALLDELAP